MRVLAVTDYGSPYPGSFVPMLRAGLQECAARGMAAHAVFPDRARGRTWLADLDGIEVRFTPEGSRTGSIAWLRGLLAEAREPTILHTHFSRFDMPAVAAAAGRRDVKVLWHIHTVLGQGAGQLAANRFKLAVVGRRVERILCVAPHLAEGVLARGAPRGRVEYFPNALDTDAHVPISPEHRRAARESLGLPQDATVALHFGRDWELKGGDLFLRSVARLREGALPGLAAVSARGGEPARTLAAELGIGAALETPDAVYDVTDLYAAADILMATSRGEGMPLTVLEALAHGLPVVASDISGHHIPGADLPGMAIAPLDPAALAQAAERLLARPAEEAERDADAGRQWLQREMGLEQWADRLAGLYEALA